MPLRWDAMKLLLAIVLTFLLSMSAMAQQISQGDYNSTYANKTVSSAYSYVTTVNESSYLIFSPHLSEAYMYLGMASGNVTSNPSLAVNYANRATAIAREQYAEISHYRYESSIVMSIITVAIFALLLKIMMPPKKQIPKER